MAMSRKRPFADEEAPYAYVWRTNKVVLYVGFGKGRRCVVSEAAAKHRSTALRDYITKVGVDAVKVEVYAAKSRAHAKDLERTLIAELSPMFNSAPGVGGYPGMHTEEGLQHIRASASSRKMSEQRKLETSQRMLGNTHLLGHVHTEETRSKISKAAKGRKHTEEARKRIRAAKIGSNNPMYGRPSPRRGVVLSDETKQKLRTAALLRSQQRGNKGA